MSSERRIRVARALDLLPETEDLLPLRAAIVEAAGAGQERSWTGSELYRSVGTREADPDLVTARAAALAKESRLRTEEVFRLAAEAVRAAAADDLGTTTLLLVKAGEVEEGSGRLLTANAFYERARRVGRRCRERRMEGLAIRRLGRIARALGSLDEAESLYRESLSTAEAEGDAEGVVVACQGLGNVAGDLERWDDAFAWYERVRAAHSHSLPTRLLWQLQVNLSIAERKRGDLIASRAWIELARQSIESTGDEGASAYLSNAEGILAEAEGDPARAEAIFRTALLAERGAVERATLLVNLGDCLTRQRRFPEAVATVRELEETAVARSLHSFLPYVYRTLGGIAAATGDENGFVFFEQALELAGGSRESPQEVALTQREYARFELTFGRLESAEARFGAAEERYRHIGAFIPADAVAHERALVLERLSRASEDESKS